MVKRTVLPARNRLVKSVQNLRGKSVSVGYFADQGLHPDSGMTYPELMFLQEIKGVRSKGGLVHRRLFEKTSARDQREIISGIRKSVQNNLMSDSNQILEDFGQSMQKRLQNSFGDTTLLEPNAPSTIQKKKANTPLVDSGLLRDKLTYRIRGKSSD